MAYLIIAIMGEVIGTSALKASNGFTQLTPTLISLAGFAIALFFLSVALKTIPIGIAYAIWSGVGIIAISLIGLFIYKQTFDIPALLGIGLILAGVLVINMMSSTISI